MKAVVFAGAGAVRVDSVPDPVLIDADDALVRVRRAAVCGTDLHLVAHPTGLPVGTVLGHEFVGEVLDIGPGVGGHRVGDLVAGADFAACGRCWWCRHGDHWECEQRRFFGTGTAFGPALPGAQAQLVRVPHADTTLRPVPPSIPLDAAVFLGDTLATAYVAVQRTGLQAGDTVVVLGGGPVGQLTSLVAQACGAGVVVVVEPIEPRRALAGAQGALTADPNGARSLIDRITDDRGADAVIDAVGGPRGLDTALGLVRRRGVVVSVGVHTEPAWTMPVDRAFVDELTVRFAVGDLMRDGEPLTALLRAGVVDPTVLGARTVALDAVPDAYRAMADRRTLKTLIAT
jgi:threonine dehydrogenase-like Zn-dependent dehydrogenase